MATVRPNPPTGGVSFPREIVPAVIQQHVDDAAILHSTRTALTQAPHVKLHHLRRFDDRLAAHLDGLAVAGEGAVGMCEAALEVPNSSATFVATVRALEDRREDWLQRLVGLTESVPECGSGLRSAFGWLEREHLRGVVAGLLGSTDPKCRRVGIAASALHRVDPGLVAACYLEDPDPAVRARALRTAGELGRRELVSAVVSSLLDTDEMCRFWAAWSAVLLGDRQNALEYLRAVALSDGPVQPRAFQLALQAMPVSDAHEMLRRLTRDPARLCMLIRGTGLVGDCTYISWLIGHMANDRLARVAGEAFSMITGADLPWLDLERKPPESIEAGPNDDANDPNVDMDPDENLPWPDQRLVQEWWTQHGPGFDQNSRYFVGALVTRGHCIDVLKNGYQRHRIAAAYHLGLSNPGTPLFEWRAPAWRQQRELAQMT